MKAEEIAFMNHMQLLPEKWDIKMKEKELRLENKFFPKIEANTDDFTCGKCKSNAEIEQETQEYFVNRKKGSNHGK